jgi:hypothetical protein
MTLKPNQVEAVGFEKFRERLSRCRHGFRAARGIACRYQRRSDVRCQAWHGRRKR